MNKITVIRDHLCIEVEVDGEMQFRNVIVSMNGEGAMPMYTPELKEGEILCTAVEGTHMIVSAPS